MKYLLASMLLAIAGCQDTEHPVISYVWLDREVVSLLQNAPVEADKIRPRLHFEDGAYADSCKSYWSNKAGVSETAANFTVRSEYLVCDAIKLHQRWPAAPQGVDHGKDFSLCNRLDLTSFSNSLQPRLGGEAKVLREVFQSGVIDSGTECVYEGEGRKFALSAILEIEERGRPKKLWVWVVDEITDTTYRAYFPVWFEFDPVSATWIAAK
ncbi:MAG TPA: hypothetical protein VFV39_09100 [Limnobacter sp.]|nr:hypothetical protein [Limnobacter sp.]